MKHLKILRLAAFALLIGTATLASCADKQTDRHSEMSGGHESGTDAGIGNNIHSNPAATSNGMGQPVAGGRQNTVPDTLSNQDSTKTNKPF